MAFNNESIQPPRKKKVHICMRDGRWRVSSTKNKPKLYDPGSKAHSHVRKLNSRIDSICRCCGQIIQVAVR